MERFKKDPIADLRTALADQDLAEIDDLRKKGLSELAHLGSLPDEALDLLARACVRRSDLNGIATIADALPARENMPLNGNKSLREMAHLQIARAYVYSMQNDLVASPLFGHWRARGKLSTIKLLDSSGRKRCLGSFR